MFRRKLCVMPLYGREFSAKMAHAERRIAAPTAAQLPNAAFRLIHDQVVRMVFLTARFSVFAAVALVTAAQVVVTPAACCVLSSALVGGEACCGQPVDDRQACCQPPRQAATFEGDTSHAPESDECLWCAAEPKIGSPDRVAPPPIDDVDFSVATAPAVAGGLLVSPPASSLDEPFHRTAPAACAWLCVWRE